MDLAPRDWIKQTNIDTGIPEKRETMGFLPTLQKDKIKSSKQLTNNSSYRVLYNAII